MHDRGSVRDDTAYACELGRVRSRRTVLEIQDNQQINLNHAEGLKRTDSP